MQRVGDGNAQVGDGAAMLIDEPLARQGRGLFNRRNGVGIDIAQGISPQKLPTNWLARSSLVQQTN